jgi:hypothetical protein
MVRLQIQLTPAQHRQVRTRARRLGVSVSEVIRRSIDAQLTQPEGHRDDLARRALAVAGKYAEPRSRSNVAAHHDAALAEAYRR